MTRSDCAVLLYNTLTATTKSGSTYGNTIGLTVSDGQVDTSAILASQPQGPLHCRGKRDAALQPHHHLPQR